MNPLAHMPGLANHLMAGSWLMIPLILVTIGIWYTYLNNASQLRESLRDADFDQLGIEGRLTASELPSVAQELGSFAGAVPRIVRHVLRRVHAGFPFREAYAQCREAEMNRFGYGLIVLGALVVVAPLLGLLGTVLGMIQTFDAVAANSSETADLVAGGISKALITTQVGLLAALPGTLGLAHVFRLYRRLTNAVDLCETQLAVLFEHATESQEEAA